MTAWIEPGAEFAELLRSFRTEAWRWESQGTYRQPAEEEPWRRWRAGEPDSLDWLRPWLDDVRAATRSGRRFARVRVFHQPPTEYQRWQLDVTPVNISAGEDMRVLTASQAVDLALPAHDFWLLDDTRVARMHFHDQQFVGAELIDDPDEVDLYREWKRTAWDHAVPFADYMHDATQRSR